LALENATVAVHYHYRSMLLPYRDLWWVPERQMAYYPASMALILTKHARDNVALYNLDPAWIEATITSPQHTDRDPDDAILLRAWRRIPEHGGRALRVVYRLAGADMVVVTAFFDRGVTRWLPP
jgi:hypothetical protein